VVDEAVGSPEISKAILLNVASVDKGEGTNDEEFETKAPVVKQVVADEEVEPVAEPTKRASKKAEVPAAASKKSLADVVSAWSEDE
jgi:hypothetical protein